MADQPTFSPLPSPSPSPTTYFGARTSDYSGIGVDIGSPTPNFGGYSSDRSPLYAFEHGPAAIPMTATAKGPGAGDATVAEDVGPHAAGVPGASSGGDGGRRPPRRWQWSPRWPFVWRWHSSWNMYASFVLGVAAALGHHIFYNSLRGKVATDQLRMQRYGTILAFIAKAALTSAVVMAFRQRIWATVRQRLMTVAAVDCMFAATEDLTALLNWEFLTTARIAAALAFFSWLAPFIVILTANTLVVQMRAITSEERCPGVRTLNFSHEESNDWRKPIEIVGLWEIPLSLWNTTKADDDPDDGDWFDYYTGPGSLWQQTASIGGFQGEPVTRRGSATEICGAGWNCTFEIAFTAPGYRCSEVASGVGSVRRNLTQQSGQAVPPFGTEILVPEGNHTYYAYASGGEYSPEQLKDLGIGGRPLIDKPYPPNFGALRTEPLVWIGYSEFADKDATSATIPTNRSDARWDTAFVPKVFACEHVETSYKARFNYTDSIQKAEVLERTYHDPIINTTFFPRVDSHDGTNDNTTAWPEANYVFPTDVKRYRKIAAYHSVGHVLRDFVNGTVTVASSLKNPIANTKAIQTKLLDPRNNYFPQPGLMDLVRDLYEDLVLSILSNPQFVEVVWAAKTDTQTGTLGEADQGTAQESNKHDGSGSGGDGNDDHDHDHDDGDDHDHDDDKDQGVAVRDDKSLLYPCTRSRSANMYAYDALTLWLVYAVAIALSLLGIVAGIAAVHKNGGETRDTRFSSIVAATRGPALEKVDWHEQHPSDIKKMKLGYGPLDQDDPDASPEARTGAAVAGGLYPRPATSQTTRRTRFGFKLNQDHDINVDIPRRRTWSASAGSGMISIPGGRV